MSETTSTFSWVDFVAALGAASGLLALFLHWLADRRANTEKKEKLRRAQTVSVLRLDQILRLGLVVPIQNPQDLTAENLAASKSVFARLSEAANSTIEPLHESEEVPRALGRLVLSSAALAEFRTEGAEQQATRELLLTLFHEFYAYLLELSRVFEKLRKDRYVDERYADVFSERLHAFTTAGILLVHETALQGIDLRQP